MYIRQWIKYLIGQELEVKNSCHLNEKAEEDPKAAKVAVVLFNVLTADPWSRATKPKGIRDEYLSSNRN